MTALIEIWGGKVVYIWMVILEMFFIHICSSEFSIFFTTTITFGMRVNKGGFVCVVGIRYGMQKRKKTKFYKKNIKFG